MRTGIRAILRIAGGSAMGQVFLILATMASTRLFEPAHLGALGLVTTLAALGEVVLGGRLDLALPVAGDDKRFSQLAFLLESVTARLILAGSVFAIMFSTTAAISNNVLSSSNTAVALVLVASAVALRFDARILMAIRNRLFSIVGDAQAAAGFTQAIALIVGGLLVPSAFTAAATFIIGRLCGSYLVLRAALPKPPAIKISVVTALSRYPDFPRFAMPTGFVNSLIIAMPITYSATQFDMATAGIAFVVWRLLVSPTQLLGRSIGQVVYGESAASGDLFSIRSGAISAMFRTSLVGLFIAVGAAAMSLFDYTIIFGEKWELVDSLIAPIGLVAGAQLAVSPLRNILTRIGLQYRLLVLQLVRLFVCLIAFGVAWATNLEVSATFWSYALAVVLANLLLAKITLSSLSEANIGKISSVSGSEGDLGIVRRTKQ